MTTIATSSATRTATCEARELFEQVALADDYADFLTVAAYAPSTEGTDHMTGLSLAELNAAPDGCRCEDGCAPAARPNSWVARLVAGRPYADEAALYATLTRPPVVGRRRAFKQALAGHPAHRSNAWPATPARWSQQEQSGVSGADARLRQSRGRQRRSAMGNRSAVVPGRRHRQGRRRRAAGDRPLRRRQVLATERGVVLAELAKINRLAGLPSCCTRRPMRSLPTRCVLDAGTGSPAEGVAVALEERVGEKLASGRPAPPTPMDGCVTLARRDIGAAWISFDTGRATSATSRALPCPQSPRHLRSDRRQAQTTTCRYC